jgi:hypothetical protein
MAEFSAFHKDVLPQLPGAPIPVINYALLQSAIQFAEDSLILQYEADVVSVRPNVADYEVPLVDEQTELAMVMRVLLDGRLVNPVASDNRPTHLVPAQTYEVVDGEGEDPQLIRLLATPTQSGVLAVRVAVKPKQDAPSVPDELWRHHRYAIGCGAMASLMTQTGKTWSQPALGAAHYKEFRALVAKAQVDANRNETRANLRVNNRPFA